MVGGVGSRNTPASLAVAGAANMQQRRGESAGDDGDGVDGKGRRKEGRKEGRRSCLVSTAFVCDPNREARVQRQK